jgi:hypothetical protein
VEDVTPSVTGNVSNWWDQRWADAFQLRSGTEVLVAMMENDPVHGIEGVPYRVQRLTLPGRDVVSDCVFGLPQRGVEELVVSPSERFAVAFLNSGEGQCGYEVFSIDGAIRRLGVGQPFTLPEMLSPPTFSPDERLLVSACASGDRAWWADPKDKKRTARTPAVGGHVTFGQVIVHDLEKNLVTRHRLELDLPAGWLPGDHRAERWVGPEGVEFIDERRIEIGMPDGSDVELELPLGDAVLLPSPDSGS